MSRNRQIEELEKAQLKKNIPEFNVGDTIKVSRKIVEGDKERVQTITGTVIARRGSGVSETFSLYRTAYGAAMEGVFVLHSPRISNIEVMKRGKVRRSKLYYIRGMFGKKSKVEERILSRKGIATVNDTQVSVDESSEA